MGKSSGIGLGKKWIIDRPDEDAVAALQKELQISRLLASLLVNRGIADPEEARSFLFPNMKLSHDPFALPDMEGAVERILSAVSRGEHITIYGDYDVDGVTATALLFSALTRLIRASGSDSRVDYYIPNRLYEGYGLNAQAIDVLAVRGTDLIVTVDCGITDDGNALYARQAGIDMIVTDHHEVGNTLPPAVAVINPKRADSSYPFSELAGVGVAFKLCTALQARTGIPLLLLEGLELVALGTVADVVPLVGENRLFVVEGLKRLSATERPGLRSLISVAGIAERTLTSYDIAFRIAPRLNASGRLDSAGLAVELLTTGDEERAQSLAEELDRRNRERQEVEQRIFAEAVDMVESGYDLDSNPIIVLASDSWHPGVVGLVASRLQEKYYRPAMLIALEDESGRGSARSIPALDVYRLLRSVSAYLEGFGGHKQAAGFSIKREAVRPFFEEVNRLGRKLLADDDLVPEVRIDAELNTRELNMEVVSEIQRLEPFGFGNRKPVFLLRNVTLEDFRAVGADGSHLKVTLGTKDGGRFFGISFGNADLAEGLLPAIPVDLVFTPEENEWNGNTRLSLRVADLRVSGTGREIVDNRNCPDKADYLRRLLNWGDSVAVVAVNSSSVTEIISGLSGRLTSSFGGIYEITCKEGRITVVRPNELGPDSTFSAEHVVIYDLPYSRKQLLDVFSGLQGGRLIHLVYGKGDAREARRRFYQVSPNRRTLRYVYSYIKKRQVRAKSLTKLAEHLAGLTEGASSSVFSRALKVLEEAGLIGYDSSKECILPLAVPEVDFSRSALYRKWEKHREEFQQLSQLLVNGNSLYIKRFFDKLLDGTEEDR